MSRRAWFLVVLILATAAGAELAMGRNPICTCGTVELWVGARDSAKTSQMLADWYSLSHVVHGLLFYAGLWLIAGRWPVEWRFLAAMLLEAAWEVAENTPLVIDRYRSTTAAIGYTGDSILNSMSDIIMMALGFMIARKLPIRATLLLLIAREVVPLVAIRDDLTLNILNLIVPIKAVQQWQAGG
jgi:hypothetical protein